MHCLEICCIWPNCIVISKQVGFFWFWKQHSLYYSEIFQDYQWFLSFQSVLPNFICTIDDGYPLIWIPFFHFSLFVLFINTKQTFQNKTGLSFRGVGRWCRWCTVLVSWRGFRWNWGLADVTVSLIVCSTDSRLHSLFGSL